MSHLFTLVLNCVALGYVLLSCATALRPTLSQSNGGKAKDWFYEDVDGRAIPQSLAAFSNRGAKFCILLFAIAGLGSSVGRLVVSIVHNTEETWGSIAECSLPVAIWSFMLVHAICIKLQNDRVRTYRMGLGLLGSALFSAIASISAVAGLPAYSYEKPSIAMILSAVSTAAAISLLIAASCIPRRPDVFHKDALVDRQWSVSVLSRLTWTWIHPLLRHAALHRDIDVADVPQPGSQLRSCDLKAEWDNLEKQPSLCRSLLTAYKGRLALLWITSLVRCAVSMLPFWAMLQVLSLLEGHAAARSDYLRLIAFVTCMALSNFVDSWMEGWAYWYSLADLALPIRSQVSGLIFEKSLRRKIIRGARNEESASEPEDGDQLSEEPNTLESDQAVVNLVGIDTERLSFFLQYHFLIITGVVKLVIFSIFLLKLLGWMPFAAGLAAWAVTLPFNTWFSTKLLNESRTLMRRRDTKLSKINEVLMGMRQIKFSAMESQWEKRIHAIREAELATLWKFFLADSGIGACWVISPILLAVASLTAYVILHGSLLPSVAFVSIGIFNTLETTLGSLPELFTLGLDSLVSLRRIETYLDKPDRQKISQVGPAISFQDASISWPVDSNSAGPHRSVLSGLDLSFPNHALSVIHGKVGTGKSLMLSAILGEAELLKGSIFIPKTQDPESVNAGKWIVRGSVAYVSQLPWLESTSVRNNILFGLPLDKERYTKVLDACALRQDLDSLPDGDSTELGSNGVNLSGGQKWRVTLARAVYSRAEILLLEDIFSAVDAHVGAAIFDKCLAGDICRGRTRILVTHHLGLAMRGASYVVELSDGGVKSSGRPQSQDNKSHPLLCPNDDDEDSATDSDSTLNLDSGPGEPTIAPKKFMQDETRQRGKVKSGVYLTYVKGSGGVYLWALCMGIYVAYQAGIIGRAWWLRIWTVQSGQGTGNNSFTKGLEMSEMAFSTQTMLHRPSSQSRPDPDVLFYLKIYVAISIATAAIGIIRYIASYFLAIKASRALFKKMLFAVMHVPLRWLDTVDSGRILNRFTADFNITDERLIMTWSLFFSNLLRLIGICVASCFASVYLIPPAMILLSIGVIIGSKYLTASRPLKRLESNAKSPVFELFSTTLSGIATIRAFRRTQTYLTQMHNNLDAWTMTTFSIALANRWMSFRMALIACSFSIAVGAAVVVSSIDAALAGLALSFILDFSESLRWTIKCYGDMELEMNSMERVVEYMNLETEPLGGVRPSAAWPTSGSIELDNLEVAYAPDLSPVLKGVTLKINHGERIGVVGRTGAGKSSFTLALFRFLEARSGKIAIDGVDISSVPLSDLRSRLSIIPQDPVLFSGTIRSNLDPFGEYTDIQLYDVLLRVHLIRPEDDVAKNIFCSLSSPISESGGNLSRGQQQLLCIARALLAAPKILVLDEATSAIDVATDKLIQKSIREWFVDTTLVVVAHRLSTVADFDRLVVFDEGRMVECGTPRDLWEGNGLFRKMCGSTGDSGGEILASAVVE